MTSHKIMDAVRQALHQSALVRGLPVLSIAALAALGGSPALAQEAEATLEEVTVTGSRIRQETGMTTPVPVTSLSVTELLAYEPGAALVDQLDSLPQLFQTESAQRSSGALFGNAGGSYVNLRGLGSQRTLVLLDGTRVAPADRVGAVNIGIFPTALIKSVDIVTGGASAQYGADAVGGVVNFVLDRNFEGLKVSGGTGGTEIGDGTNRNLSVAGGFKIGDRLNVIGSAEVRDIEQIMRNPEELGSWYERRGFVTNPAWVALPAASRATSGIPQRLTLPNVISSVHSPTGLIVNGYSAVSAATGLGSTAVPTFTLLRNTFTNDGRGVRPFVNGSVTSTGGAGSTFSMSGGPEFDSANRAFSGGPYGAQVKERSAFTGLKYDLSDTVKLIGQAHYGISESNQPDQRGLPHLQDIWFATIYSGNPFLPTSVQSAMTAQNVAAIQVNKHGQWLGQQNWNDSEDPRNRYKYFSWNVGVEAEVFNDWQFKVNYQQGRTDKFTAVYDELRVDRMFLALDAVRDTRVGSPTNGQIICNVQLANPSLAQLQAAVAANLGPGGLPRESKFGGPLLSPIGLDQTISGCVPLNAFGQGQVSQAARDYLVSDKVAKSFVDQAFAELLLTGNLFEGWAGPIGAAIGATYRDQSFAQRAFSGGIPGPTEVEALGPPLNAPALGIRGIPGGFTGGSANLHQFSTVPPISGGYDVWEVFGEIQVPLWNSGSGQRLDVDGAFRHSEYSSSGSVDAYKFGLDFQIFSDLRLRSTYSRDVREATFSERFDLQGGGGTVIDRFAGPSFGQSLQITTVRQGTVDLLPEKADTITVGMIYRPSWLDGLQASVDWYSVKIDRAIVQLGQQNIMDQCFAGATALCPLIERSGAVGSSPVVRVIDPFLNAANAKVRGVDIELAYTIRPDFLENQDESISIRGFGSRLLERSNLVQGGVRQQLGGGFTTGVLYPDWKADLSVAYNFGNFGVQVSEEYISKSLINTTWIEGRDVDDNTLPNYFNTNLRLSYKGETASGSRWDVSFFVNNLLDKHPMIIPSFDSRAGAQTVSNNYDAYGRRFQLGVNFRL